MPKKEKLQKELDRSERFKNGISWHEVTIEDKDVIENILVADELGEDINAYEMVSEARREGRQANYKHIKDVCYNESTN